MPPTDFFWFLSQSIDLLEKESSQNYSQLAAELNGLRASISAGEDRRLICFDEGRFFIDADAENHDIEVVCGTHTILELLDGKYSLEQALLDEVLFIKGNVGILGKFSNALSIYCNGALRSPGFLGLLSQYRHAVSSGG
jgi:hypothetical protein